MAKSKKSGMSKSAMIRQVWTDNPQAGPSDISRLIKKRYGADVSASMVSTVTCTDRAKAEAMKDPRVAEVESRPRRGEVVIAESAVRPNKSAAIREYKLANPTASPKEIAAKLLETKGIVVTPSAVSVAISHAKKNGWKVGSPGRPHTTSATKRTVRIYRKKGKRLSDASLVNAETVIAMQKFIRLHGEDATVDALRFVQRMAQES